MDILVYSRAPVQLSSLIFNVLLTRNPLLSLSKCAHQWVQHLQGKQVLPFTRPVLQHYRQLSPGARTQVAATGQVLECVFIHSILSLAVTLIILYYNVFFYKVNIVRQVCVFRWAAPYLLLADGLVLLTTVRYAYTLIFFALSGLVQLSLTLYLHLRDLKRLVFRLFGQIKNRRSTPTQIIFIWSYFFRQHSLALTDLMTFNSEVVSTLLFWVCLPLLSSSVYCLCLLYFFRLEPIVRVILCFCLLLHATTFAIFTFLPPVSRALYTVTGQLYRAQMTLPSGKGHHQLKGRLKMTAYYEILCTNKKVTYTFGSYAKVDRSWLWERLMSISSDYVIANTSKNRKWTSKLNTRVLLTYSYLLLATLRYLQIVFRLSFPDSFFAKNNYFLYDPMNDLLHQLGILDRNLALLFLPQLPLLAYIDHLVSFVRGPRCYHYGHDLLVLNRQDFCLLNPQWKTLPHLGPLDHGIRVHSVALTTTLDLQVAMATLLLAALCPLVLGLFSLTTAWQGFSALPQKRLATVDGCLMLYTLWHCYKIALYQEHLVNTLLSVQLAQQRLLDRRLAGLLLLLVTFQKAEDQQRLKTSVANGTDKDRKQILQKQQLLSAFLSTAYLRRHRQLVDDMLTMDRQLVSRTLLLGLLCLFGFTIYSFSLFTLKRSRLKSSLVFTCSLLALAIILAAVRPLIAAGQLMHRPATELLYRSVQCLGGRLCHHGEQGEQGKSHLNRSRKAGSFSTSSLHLKLKLSTYYEVLTTGEQFAFSVGPLGKVTFRALFQFTFVYAAYFMFSLNFISRHK
ncbi:hypothetical protein TYRP_011502 [Tyrophagus putrescentiae]|nr:hypothetical protein TYRP_011502 [Tyrophagus putrescentiae]